MKLIGKKFDEWEVVRSVRGRTGEERTLYVIRRKDGHEEVRTRKAVMQLFGLN